MSKFSPTKLQKIRENKNLTNKEIANALEITESGVSKLFCGIRSNPQIEFLVKLADYLKCGVDDFIDYDDENKINNKDKTIIRLSEIIYENQSLYKLFKHCKDLSNDELKALINVVTTFKEQPWVQ